MRVTIELDNMQFRAFHGCYDLEKKVGNNFRVDLSIDAEIGDAAQRDDVGSTLNYLEVYQLIGEQMSITSNIIENVALRIIDALYQEFSSIKRVEIRLAKLAPPLGGKLDSAAVVMSR